MASTEHTLFSHEENESRKDKAPNALRTISEASEILDVPQHVLRFWETRFGQIKPLKRNGGRRFYRPQDLEILQQIKHLLYTQGYTIKGAKKAVDEFIHARATSGISSEEWVANLAPASVNDNRAADDNSDMLTELAQALHEDPETPAEPTAVAAASPSFPREELEALRTQLQQARTRLEAFLPSAVA